MGAWKGVCYTTAFSFAVVRQIDYLINGNTIFPVAKA